MGAEFCIPLLVSFCWSVRGKTPECGCVDYLQNAVLRTQTCGGIAQTISEQSTSFSEGVPSRNQSDSSRTVNHYTCSSSGSSSHGTRRLQVQSQAQTSEGTTGGIGTRMRVRSVRRSDSNRAVWFTSKLSYFLISGPFLLIAPR